MKKTDRRTFLLQTAGLAGAGLTGIPVIAGNNVKAAISSNPSGMISRTLGRTGIKIPVVSMGVMNSTNPNLVKEAWRNGIRHFDTAWVYNRGNNEIMLAKALKEVKAPREEIVYATKSILFGEERKLEGKERQQLFLKRFQESLDRLQTDYIDILYNHDISRLEEVNDPWIMEAFTSLKEQKKIRFAGFSTHSYWPELVASAADKGFYDVILISINYSMSHDTASLDAMNYAASKGIGLIAMKTQCQQAWYKENLPADVQKFYEGQIMHTALLKWVLQHPSIATAVPGFTTFHQLEEDLSVAYSLEYTPDELKFLNDHNVNLALQSNCRFCGKCIPSCPQQADIPSIMRAHMYAQAYGNTFMANQTIASLPAEKGLQACTHCDTCIVQCHNRVPVAKRVEEMKILFA